MRGGVEGWSPTPMPTPAPAPMLVSITVPYRAHPRFQGDFFRGKLFWIFFWEIFLGKVFGIFFWKIFYSFCVFGCVMAGLDRSVAKVMSVFLGIPLRDVVDASEGRVPSSSRLVADVLVVLRAGSSSRRERVDALLRALYLEQHKLSDELYERAVKVAGVSVPDSGSSSISDSDSVASSTGV